MDLFRSFRRADLLATTALAVAIAAGGYALAASGGSAASPSGTVTVSGTGTATERPDTLTVQMSVKTLASSTKAALDRNNAETQAVERVLFAAGVRRSDVATSGLTVGEQDDATGKKIGYAAEDDLTITLRRLSVSGAVVGAAENAANSDVSITSISYSITDVAAGERAARAAAMRDALARAKGLAGAADATVGPLVRITDQSSTPIPFARNAAGVASGAASSVPLLPGTQTLTATVEAVFTLRQ